MKNNETRKINLKELKENCKNIINCNQCINSDYLTCSEIFSKTGSIPSELTIQEMAEVYYD